MPVVQEVKINDLDRVDKLNADQLEDPKDADLNDADLNAELRRMAALQNSMLEKQAEIVSLLAANQKQLRKDLWDRLAAIAPILSGTIIALGGTYFTTIYNEQQLKLQEVQTIERFIPHLLGDEKSKRAAVLAISSLGNAKLAARVASIFASPGTVSALESIARNDSNPGDKKALNGALDRALDNMAEGYRVEKRYEDAINTYKKVLALREQTYGVTDSKVVPSLHRLAELYKNHNEYSDAEALLKRSSEIQKSEHGRDSMQYADELHKLSALYSAQGLDAKALQILNQAVAIEQKLPASSRVGQLADSNEFFLDESSVDSASIPKSSGSNTDSQAPDLQLKQDKQDKQEAVRSERVISVDTSESPRSEARPDNLPESSNPPAPLTTKPLLESAAQVSERNGEHHQ